MKIALFPDDYLPDSTLVHAKMFHELALELKRLGHEPIIITPSHGKQTKRLQVDYLDGVEIWRFRNPPMRGQGKVKRVISETLLSLNAFLAIKNAVDINFVPKWTVYYCKLLSWAWLDYFDDEEKFQANVQEKELS